MDDDLFFYETNLDRNVLLMYYISISIYVFVTLFMMIFILYVILSNISYLLCVLLFYKLIYYKSDYNKPYINYDDNYIRILSLCLFIYGLRKKINL